MSDFQLKFKLATLYWVHPSFCAHKFFQTIKLAEDENCWESLKNSILINKLLPEKADFARAERYFEKYILSDPSEIKFITPLDQEYPKQLLVHKGAPSLLSYRGQPVWDRTASIAIIGSRKMHSFSESWMNLHLGTWIGDRKICIISGGAWGVDQSAHRLALQNQVPTVAILPSGLQKCYPSGANDLFDLIVQSGGAIVSQFSPDRDVHPSLFYRRNQLLVRMCQGVVVIQAARRSGTHMSAIMALNEGKALGVVPGHPFDSQFGANLDLIFDGAPLLRGAKDLDIMIS